MYSTNYSERQLGMFTEQHTKISRHSVKSKSRFVFKPEEGLLCA